MKIKDLTNFEEIKVPEASMIIGGATRKKYRKYKTYKGKSSFLCFPPPPPPPPPYKQY